MRRHRFHLPLYVLALFMISGFITVAECGPRGKMSLHPPEARAAALAEVMQEQLALTSEQAASVREAATRHAEEIDAALGRYQRSELKKRLRAIGEARDADFRKILTAEQFEAYADQKRAIMQAMKYRMKGS